MQPPSTDDERVAWTVLLDGHATDLEDLVHWTDGHPIHVNKVDEQQFDLVLPFTEVGAEYEEAFKRAEASVVALNGVGAVKEHSYIAVTLAGGMHKVDAKGRRRDAYVGGKTMTAYIRFRGGRPTVTQTGQPAVDLDKGSAGEVLRQAAQDEKVQRALKVIGGQPTWPQLYHAYEIVKGEVGGLMFDQGWIDESQTRLFTHSADNPDAIGADARHGDAKGRQPPKNPMPLKEAIRLIRGLVRHWLRHRAQQGGAS